MSPKYFLVFDTETTGLGNAYITQLGWVIYDLVQNKIIQQYDSYICIPPLVTISEKAIELTGITREKCDTGVDICNALIMFYHACMSCDIIVAHNLSFDIRMINLEIKRNYTTLIKTCPDLDEIFNKTTYCTMLRGITVCNITQQNRQTLKRPKLLELYKALFGTDDEVLNFHNAMIDTLVCMQCYLFMQYNIVQTIKQLQMF